MPIDKCNRCSALVDVDADPECYYKPDDGAPGGLGEPRDFALCECCRADLAFEADVAKGFAS